MECAQANCTAIHGTIAQLHQLEVGEARFWARMIFIDSFVVFRCTNEQGENVLEIIHPFIQELEKKHPQAYAEFNEQLAVCFPGGVGIGMFFVKRM